MTGRGTFDARVIPQASGGDVQFSRATVEKQYRGVIEGSGVAQLLGAETSTGGVGGYVALELVNATLQGRSGTFILQHSGRMQGGAMEMKASILPGSGTGDLAGLAGSLTITISEKVHAYELDYSLPR